MIIFYHNYLYNNYNNSKERADAINVLSRW